MRSKPKDGIVFVALAAMLLAATTLDYSSCKVRGRLWGVDTRWGITAGCTVEAEPGRWVKVEDYRRRHANP